MAYHVLSISDVVCDMGLNVESFTCFRGRLAGICILLRNNVVRVTRDLVHPTRYKLLI